MNTEEFSEIADRSKAHTGQSLRNQGKTTAAKLALSLVILLTHTACAMEKDESIDLLRNADREITRVEKGQPSTWRKTITFCEPGEVTVMFRAVFDVADLSSFVFLTLAKPLEVEEITLNGKAVPMPLRGMRYKNIPAIPLSMLQRGRNVLAASWGVKIEEHKDKETGQNKLWPQQLEADRSGFRLIGQHATELAIQTGPVLGCAGYESFTVTCRLNMPAQAFLTVDGKSYRSSSPGLIHTFVAKGLKPDTKYPYTITASLPGRENMAVTTGPHAVQTLPVGDKLIFAALGDSRTFPDDWAQIASAVVRARPAFVVFSGDMVVDGVIDYQWDEEYFGAAKDFFATIPYYAVIGNHEHDCPLFLQSFRTPNGTKNWSQAIGPILLVGIDGEMDWSPDGTPAAWLDRVLSGSRAKFIFLATHYPAWSSGLHGGVDTNGHLHENTMRQMQETVMPILARYGATAMIAGHDHNYERSEPPNGVTMIVSGGAGAPLRNKGNHAEKQNPYSKVFVTAHHYCLFILDGDTCTMKVYTPENQVLDTRVWRARKPAQHD